MVLLSFQLLQEHGEISKGLSFFLPPFRRLIFVFATPSMASENWEGGEQEETGCQQPAGPLLCANNCGFFGSPATMNLCSKCYRDTLLKQADAAAGERSMASLFADKAFFSDSVAPSSPEEKLLDGRPICEKPAGETSNLGSEFLDHAAEGPSGTASLQEVPAPGKEEPVAKLANRCFACRKRVGLTGFKCRCGDVFCALHRYSDKHNCSFDYKAVSREAIAKANPVVKANKIEKI